jgi:hypothetical protein
LSDLRERLAALCFKDTHIPLLSREEIDAIQPIVEAELAQATADALEAAVQEAARCADTWADWCTPDGNLYSNAAKMIADNIRALVPTDIAAKAKEHDDKVRAKTITQCNDQTIKELKAGHCDIPGGKEALAERDAKIRREVFDLLDAAIPEDADETHPVAVIYQLLAARGMKLPRKVICHRCGRDCRWGYGKIAALRFCLPCTSGFMAWWEGKRAAPKPEGPQ